MMFRWMEKRRKNHIEKMKSLGKCPDCRGYGVVIVPMHYIGSNVECYTCKGTGEYSVWENNR
ncbi:methionine aminopeptidase [Metabacillus litoralis]|nr:methionine aminopeptidase [Metabacillus litoralis]MCM3163035.1 methionine aminopeptidase [Metabacillus litoralis]UHA58173.1 methionine aminopeptidase [Metabacillus litoralis]